MADVSIPKIAGVRDTTGAAVARMIDLATEARNAQSAIDAMKGKDIDINININENVHRAVGYDAPTDYLKQASGGDYLVNKATSFIAGEAGPERAIFIPQGQPGFNGPLGGAAGGGAAGGGIGVLNLNVYGTADAHETAQIVMAEFQGRGLMPQRPMR